MKSDFSRIITNLRKEKNVSQRQASDQLEISQALLSHYEKCAREPGLAFVVRAANYYNVSCDYLLGRSLDKHGFSVSANQIHDTSEDKDNVLTGSVVAMLQKKLIINSISVIIDVVGRTKNKDLINEVASYFHISIYKIYRYLSKQTVDTKTFSSKEQYFEALCDAEARICEMKIKSIASNDDTYINIEKEVVISDLSNENIANLYPKHASSLFSVVQAVSDTINTTTNPKTNTKPKKTKKSKK